MGMMPTPGGKKTDMGGMMGQGSSGNTNSSDQAMSMMQTMCAMMGGSMMDMGGMMQKH